MITAAAGDCPITEAVQPLGQIVQLVDIYRFSLQSLQDGVLTKDLVHLAVPRQGISHVHRIQRLHDSVILVVRDREGNGKLSVLGMLRI